MMHRRLRWSSLLGLFVAAGCSETLIGTRSGVDQEYMSTELRPDLAWIERLDRAISGAKPAIEVMGKRPDGTILLSFVHASDVQIRDWGLYYHSRNLEPFMDKFASGVVREEELDRRDEYPFLALVAAINAERERLRERNRLPNPPYSGPLSHDEFPAFLVHTGDAIDAGAQGEFFEFLNVANRLKIPWFDVVGNHDVFVLGNFPQRKLKLEHYDPSLRFVVSRSMFRGMHDSGIVGTHLPGIETRVACHPPTEGGTALTPPVQAHGFGELNGPGLSYAVRLSPTRSIRFRIVALDTVALDKDTFLSEKHGIMVPGPGAFSGRLTDDAFAWLAENVEPRAIPAEPREFLLVFGHHPLRSKKEGDLMYDSENGGAPKRLVDYLMGRANVLGYFSGHTHVPNVYPSHRPGETVDFVEVTAPSLHEHPQFAFLIHVVWRSEGGKLLVVTRPIRGVAKGSGSLGQQLRIACEVARRDASPNQIGVGFDDECWLAGGKERFTSETEVASGVDCPLCERDDAGLSRFKVAIVDNEYDKYDNRRPNHEVLRDLLSERDDIEVSALTATCYSEMQDLVRDWRNNPPSLILIHRGAFDHCTSEGYGEAQLGAFLSDVAEGAAEPVQVRVYSKLALRPYETSAVQERVKRHIRPSALAKLRLDSIPLTVAANFSDACAQSAMMNTIADLLPGR